MQDWKITGLDKESGEEVQLIIVADDEESATRTAMEYGIVTKSAGTSENDPQITLQPASRNTSATLQPNHMFQEHPIWTIALGVILAHCLMTLIGLILWFLLAGIIATAMS